MREWMTCSGKRWQIINVSPQHYITLFIILFYWRCLFYWTHFYVLGCIHFIMPRIFFLFSFFFFSPLLFSHLVPLLPRVTSAPLGGLTFCHVLPCCHHLILSFTHKLHEQKIKWGEDKKTSEISCFWHQMAVIFFFASPFPFNKHLLG